MTSDAHQTAARSVSHHYLKPRMTGRGVFIASVAWLFYSVLLALPIASYERIPFVGAKAGQVQSSVLLALTWARK